MLTLCRHFAPTMLLAFCCSLGFAQANGGSLSFLSGLSRKHPYDVKLFANPIMKARLTALMKADAALIAPRFQADNPIDKSGDLVAMWGNKPHDGGLNDALIVVNTKTDELWVWMKVKGKLKRYGPATDPSGLSQDAATALANEKANWRCAASNKSQGGSFNEDQTPELALFGSLLECNELFGTQPTSVITICFVKTVEHEVFKLFAGISLTGSTMRSDDGADEALYGRDLSANDVVFGGKLKAPIYARPLLHELNKVTPKHK